MDLESIERCWREEAGFSSPRLEEGAVLRMIESRAVDLRRAVRRRLRREAGYYLPMMVLSAATLLSGFTLNRVVAACVMVLLIGAVVATLRHAERRIQDAPLDRSVRDALTRLASEVDAASRSYLAVYVTFFGATGAALSGFVWWRHGVGGFLAAAVAGSVVALLWSRHSGRGYVERMFRRYRAELADCLRQLGGEA